MGLFRKRPQVERAIRDLEAARFADHQIGVLMHDSTGGGLFGLLAGVGVLAVPGIGSLVAGGALASALAGARTGAAAGGLLGALVGMGIPEEEARFCERGLRAGGILLTVDAGPREADAEQILIVAGAEFARERAAASPTVEEHREWSAREAREVHEPWRGNERRYGHDPAYAGPERRLAGI